MGKVTQIVRATVGAHEQMSIWIDHKLAGTLTLGLGDGESLEALLKAEPPVVKALDLAEAFEAEARKALQRIAELERALGDHGARGFACPHCAKAMTFCAKHGPYRRSDENQCPACMRGEA